MSNDLKEKIMMKLIIDDPSGVKNGIWLGHIRNNTNPSNDCIDLKGDMEALGNGNAGLFMEPEVECTVLDRYGNVADIILSTHNGCFWSTHRASFHIFKSGISSAVRWEDIEALRLKVIFIRPSH